MQRIIVAGGSDFKTLNDYVLNAFIDYEVQALRKAIKDGVRLNGVAAKPKAAVHEGDIIELYLANVPGFAPTIKFEYEDDNIVLFNKQPGVSCLAEGGCVSLYDLAVKHMEQKGEYSLKGQLVPYLCHNIDTHIGGLMIVAKHEIIYQEVIRALKERRIRRFYKCITLSGPREDAGQLHGFITRARKGDRAEVLLKPGRGTRHTLTKYRVLQTNAALSLLEAEAVTDEPHQIRAHFAKCGFAVLGDALYGKKAQNKKYGVQLPAIWADRILFDTGKNNPLAYLDGKDIIATRADLPYIDFGTES